MIPVLSTILDSVVDTIAPPIPALENLIYHWEKFMINYLEWTSDGKCSQIQIEQTNVSAHLEIFQQILLLEDKNEEITTNLCMEYVLKNDIFNMLVIMAEKEKLSGMRNMILKLMTNLISQLRNPMLAHQSIFIPLQKLINLCDYVSYNEQQADQINFLKTLCILLNKQQNLGIIFFSYGSDMHHIKEPQLRKDSTISHRLNILNCILLYINTKDTEVYNQCCNSILLIAKLNDENVIDLIIKNTNLCFELSTHLKNLFSSLPFILDYKGLETIDLNWRDDYNATYSNDVTKFFCWLNFIIEIIKDGQLKISCSLCESLRFLFLEKIFVTTKDISISHVFILKKMYKAAEKTPLVHTINKWLRSELNCMYYKNQTPLDILIKSSSATDETLVFYILSYFIDILNNSDNEILDYMILQFVINRNYHENFVSGCWSDEEDEREKKLLSDKNNFKTSRTLAPSSIDRIINRLLSLVPQNLQSDPSHTFKDYLKCTKNSYEDIFIKCKQFDWPSEAIDSIQFNAFDEGPFLKMIFEKISNIPNQSSLITLQIKTIFINLSYLPHPYLHEYLLNSTLPLKKNVTSAYVTLNQVLKELHKIILTVPNYCEELIRARKRILNSSSEKIFNKKNDVAMIFDSAIILEELCKELVAILFVKYHHSNSFVVQS